MFWDEEKVEAVFETPDDVQNDPYIRKGKDADRKESTRHRDRETGKYITLWQEKLLYPYKTKIPYEMTVITNKRTFKLTLKLLDKDNITGEDCFVWNGQNIPLICWTILGISKNSAEGLQASKWHDNLLCAKEDFMEELREQDPEMTKGEYRRLTTLIYRQWLKNMGISTFKANIMGGAVGLWQFCSPQWWDIE